MLRSVASGAAAFAVAAAGTVLLAQQAPVFRSGVDLVTVDVSVLDPGGRPVQGLSADQMRLRVDGQPRRIVWAEYVTQRRERPAIPLIEAPSYSTNEAAGRGRLILIAVDQWHIRRVEGLSALRAAANFLDALDPGDRVAAAPLDYAGPIQFTNEHARVKTYLQTLRGLESPPVASFNLGLSEALAISDGSRTRLDDVVLRECGERLATYENPRRLAEAEGMRDPCPVQVEQESRGLAQQIRNDARQSVDALARLIERLAEIEGPKTLVLVSEGLVAEPQLVQLTELGAAARAARVTVYVLQLETPMIEASDTTVSPTLHADRQIRSEGLIRLAGSARGALFPLVGADPHPFNRILSEISGYYLVAFEAADADRDGRAHRIDVDVARGDVTVRARPSFAIASGGPRRDTESQLTKLLRSPRTVTELPLRISASVFRSPAREQVRILLAAEMEPPSGGREPHIGFLLVEEGTGVIAASGTGTTTDGRFSAVTSVRAAHYLLKMAAIDAGGRQGSAEHRLWARISGSADVRVSELMLAEAGSEQETLRPIVISAPRNRMVAYLEAYASAGWRPPEDAVTVNVTRVGSPEALTSARAAAKDAGNGRWTFRAELPLGDLAPGAYTAAARLTIGTPGAVLERAFVVRER